MASPAPAETTASALGSLAEKAFSDSGEALPSPSSYVSVCASRLRSRATVLPSAGTEQSPITANPAPNTFNIELESPRDDIAGLQCLARKQASNLVAISTERNLCRGEFGADVLSPSELTGFPACGYSNKEIYKCSFDYQMQAMLYSVLVDGILEGSSWRQPLLPLARKEIERNKI